jgi:DNA-binding GntR family transcriptional regulator
MTGGAEAFTEKLDHHPPLRERVRVRIERMIIDGTYLPGAHLVETDLAERLGVSRGPIREALYQLQLQGWVEMRPRQGAFVHRPSVEEVDQFFQVRALLESEISSLVAGKVTSDDVDALRAMIVTATKHIEEGNEEALIEANAEFHGYIHNLAANPVLVDLVSVLDKRMRWYFSAVTLERAADAWHEHTALVDALAEGDRARAVALTRTHSERTRTTYVNHRRALEEAGDA